MAARTKTKILGEIVVINLLVLFEDVVDDDVILLMIECINV